MRLFRTIGAVVSVGAWMLNSCLPANADYTTFHYDNNRTGWSSDSAYLTPSYIGGHFITLANRSLDGGQVDAQPLYQQSTDTVFVATENNSVYGLSSTGVTKWQAYLGSPVPKAYYGNCNNNPPSIGIASTPVLDSAANILYVVSYTLNGGPAYYLHALSTTNGADVIAPVLISPPGSPAFNPSVQRQRAALLEANGNIYVAFASFCDFFADQSFGQILSYSASNLAFQARYVTTNYGSCPNQNVGPSPYYLGSIWMSGFGPAADSSGNVYFTTGNGCISYYDVNNGAFSQAVLKLTPGLHLNDNTSTMFAPCHAQAESKSDLDLGSGGVTLLPDQGGSVPRLMVVGGKTGWTYMLNRDLLGGWNQPCPDHIAYSTQTNGGLWGGHVAFKLSDGNTYLAVGGNGTAVNRYKVKLGGPLSDQATTGRNLTGEGGTSPVVSSNGTLAGTAMLWYLTRPSGGTGTIYLQAYDAANLSRGRYVDVAAGTWVNNGAGPFLSPTVTNNRIIVASQNQLVIFSVSGI